MMTAPADQLGSGSSQILQYAEVLLVLAGILVLAYVALRAGLPRFLGMRTPTGGPIEILTRYPLGPKHTLYLIKAGSETFLIGTSESEVQYLTSISPENSTEILKERSEDLQRKKFRQSFSWLERKRQA
jgi:flagellar biogenesis protein FliO